MLIGFYGATASNTYVTAKSFAEQGQDVLYIRDLSDNFPFSQAVWQDVHCSLPFTEISDAKWTYEKWLAFESQVDWKEPDFVTTPELGTALDVLTADHLKSLDKAFLRQYCESKFSYRRDVIRKMQGCDYLFVCGVEAAILAWASGTPYVIWPHGADIRFASGFTQKLSKNVRQSFKNYRLYYLIRRAYAQAMFLASQDPTGIGGFVGKVTFPYKHMPLPMKLQPKLDTQGKREILRRAFAQIDMAMPDSGKYVFIPSRVDYYWKGTNMLVDALQQREQYEHLHFIFSGWGNDYLAARDSLAHLDNVTFLPCSVSKPLLLDFFSGVDLVVDQFFFGTYGTSAPESMSCGTAVMMYIDEQAFRDKGWPVPPVLNANSQVQISTWLDKLEADKVDLDELAQTSYDWISQVHGEQPLYKTFLERIGCSAGGDR